MTPKGIKNIFKSLVRDDPPGSIEKMIHSSYGFLLKEHHFKIVESAKGSFGSGIVRIENDKLQISFTIDGREGTRDISISKCTDNSESPYERSLQNSFNLPALINILEELGHSMKGIVEQKYISKGSFDRKGEVPFEAYVLFFKTYIGILYDYFTTDKFPILLDKQNKYYGKYGKK